MAKADAGDSAAALGILSHKESQKSDGKLCSQGGYRRAVTAFASGTHLRDSLWQYFLPRVMGTEAPAQQIDFAPLHARPPLLSLSSIIPIHAVGIYREYHGCHGWRANRRKINHRFQVHDLVAEMVGGWSGDFSSGLIREYPPHLRPNCMVRDYMTNSWPLCPA